MPQVPPRGADIAPMEHSPGPSDHLVKRVVLPSGKTIEVVYFGEQAAEVDLHVCTRCASHMAYPTAWEEAGPESWAVEIRCPECEELREGVFSQTAVEAFDEVLDAGTDALMADYRRLTRANMAEEMERFAAALHADAIVPEDF
jgi:hypothetical protein